MNETAPVETLAALCAGESFGRSVRDVYSASAAAFEGLRQLQSSSINARQRIVRAGDDVAVECRDLVWIPDGVEDSSTGTNRKSVRSQRKFRSQRSLFSGVSVEANSRVSRFHICSGQCLHRLIVAVPEGILLVKDPRPKRIVIESGKGLRRKHTYFLVKHGFPSSRNSQLCSRFSVLSLGLREEDSFSIPKTASATNCRLSVRSGRRRSGHHRARSILHAVRLRDGTSQGFGRHGWE